MYNVCCSLVASVNKILKMSDGTINLNGNKMMSSVSHDTLLFILYKNACCMHIPTSGDALQVSDLLGHFSCFSCRNVSPYNARH